MGSASTPDTRACGTVSMLFHHKARAGVVARGAIEPVPGERLVRPGVAISDLHFSGSGRMLRLEPNRTLGWAAYPYIRDSPRDDRGAVGRPFARTFKPTPAPATGDGMEADSQARDHTPVSVCASAQTRQPGKIIQRRTTGLALFRGGSSCSWTEQKRRRGVAGRHGAVGGSVGGEVR